jgi:hypothetical protein
VLEPIVAPVAYAVPLTGTSTGEVVFRITRYPEAAGEAAVKDPFIELDVAPEKTRLLGCAVGAAASVDKVPVRGELVKYM